MQHPPTNFQKSFSEEKYKAIAYMKKEAVITSPNASIMKARVGYQASGTGLVIGFAAGAFQNKNKPNGGRKIINQKS